MLVTGREQTGTDTPLPTVSIAPGEASETTQQHATAVLEGSSRRGFLGRLLPFLGPAASGSNRDPPIRGYAIVKP